MVKKMEEAVKDEMPGGSKMRRGNRPPIKEENISQKERDNKERHMLANDKHRNLKYLIGKLESMETILRSENMEGKCRYWIMININLYL